MSRKVFDASGAIAGRLASQVAKELLKGTRVLVVNAEKAIISGDPVYTVGFFKQKCEKGEPYHGPFYPRRPDLMLRRIIRGMLPWHSSHGRAAFKRLRVCMGMPEVLESKPQQIATKRPLKAIDLGKIAEGIGTRKTW